MARKPKGRPISGILLLDKPYGLSSNQALQTVKRLYFAQKAGHTGSLDPMATGVLPVCLGEATKFSQYLLNSDKAYTATVKLGIQTTTGDAEGEVLEEKDASHISLQDVESVVEKFLGEISQVPPMYSAIKVDGQPLYKLARQGIEIERESRDVTIHELCVEAFRPGLHPEVDIYVKCSKGTYIRTLGEDIAQALGDLGGHLTRLRRVEVGEYTSENLVTIEQLEQLKAENAYEAMDELLFPPEEAVKHLPMVEVTSIEGYHVRLGQAVFVPNAPTDGLVRIHEEDERFLGVGRILDDGRVAPSRLVNVKA